MLIVTALYRGLVYLIFLKTCVYGETFYMVVDDPRNLD